MIDTENFPITIMRSLPSGEIERIWSKPGWPISITVRELVKP